MILADPVLCCPPRLDVSVSVGLVIAQRLSAAGECVSTVTQARLIASAVAVGKGLVRWPEKKSMSYVVSFGFSAGVQLCVDRLVCHLHRQPYV
jgi:hypothetical protein